MDGLLAYELPVSGTFSLPRYRQVSQKGSRDRPGFSLVRNMALLPKP